MTALRPTPRCRCWKPTAPHQPDCPVAKAHKAEARRVDRLLASVGRKADCE